MKTVIDKIMNAVSKLKGDLDNVATPRHTDKYLYLCNESYFECLSFSDDISWELICTTDEFLATVAECETNFGKVTHGEHCNYAHASKLLLTKDLDKELDMGIDWSKYDVEVLLKDKPTPTYTQEMSNLGARLTKKPLFDVPIFTQAMADNGVSPSVGMEFICGDEMANDERTVEFKGVKVKVIGVSAMGKDKVITFCHESLGVGCGIFFSSWVKPLTPPITLIDGKAYQFYIEGFLALGFYREDRKSFFSCGNKVCGLSEADEIQPLTVEVK